ncbi:MAG: sulfite exporter TauE/SafE family protein [Promethearchaeota archaeon]|nr:MAG: sulfite exporter TauE/SafE family protein [Candidatus Lokiarchaeota archaeon]
MDIIVLVLVILLAFIAAFIDSSFGMGYGMIAPILLLLGFDALLIIPVLLLSQMICGFMGTIFHSIYRNIEISTEKERDIKITLIFTISGMVGMFGAIFLAINLSEIFTNLYIGIMIIVIGIIILKKISFQFSWNKIYIISALAAFNKAITGGGYGPIATTGQMVTGRGHKEAIAVSNFAEAFLSGFGFLLYYILNGFSDLDLVFQLIIIMGITSIIAPPLGALLLKNIKKDKANKIIGSVSILLGSITLIRMFFF